MSRSRRVLHGCAAVAVLALLAACADQTPTTPDASPQEAVQANAERAALAELTHAVAMALEDNGLRQRIKNDMRTAPFREHKLEFRRYVHGNGGGILLAKMAKATGKSREDLLALIESVRPLEFYMPVDEHRATWTGGPDVVVAAQLEDHAVPVGFTTSGSAYPFTSAEIAPPVPVLALVPVETDFTNPLSPGTYQNTSDRGGLAIGIYEGMTEGAIARDLPAGQRQVSIACDPDTAIIPCDPPPGSGGIDWSSKPTGMYVTNLYIPGDYEGFLKGDPEFEVHLQAPEADPSKAEDLRCAGEHAPDPLSRFDMNGATEAGAILIADSVEQARFAAAYGSIFGMGVVVWEDDDTACEIKVDPERLKDAFLAALDLSKTAVDVAQNGMTQMAANGVTATEVVKALPVVVTTGFALANWLKSNDEIVGVAYRPGTTPTCERDGRDGMKLTDRSRGEKGCIVLKAQKLE